LESLVLLAITEMTASPETTEQGVDGPESFALATTGNGGG
jgi:hypothetical protein